MINTSFPHWFNNNYKKYNDNEDSLPVDQHMLMALMAPRPVYVTSASKDLWADPKGSFLSLKNAESVFALYGLKSILPSTPPPVNTPVINSYLGYHNREGDHNLTVYDWSNFIKFANYHHLKTAPDCGVKTNTFLPLADAFVRNGSYAGKNYGSDTSLIVKGSATTGYSRLSYLKFSLSGVGNVTSARLRLFGRNAENTTGIDLSVYGVNTDSWTENSICYSVAPLASTSALSSVSVNNIRKYYEFDVTAFVKTEMLGDKIMTFLIKNSGNQDKMVRFNSKENKQYNPQLIIISSSSVTINSARANENVVKSVDDLEKSKIFPNPTGKVFSLKFPKKYEGDVVMQIADAAGKIYNLGKRKLNGGGSQTEVDISNLSLKPGIYFLKIHSSKKNDIIKLVVQ